MCSQLLFSDRKMVKEIFAYDVQAERTKVETAKDYVHTTHLYLPLACWACLFDHVFMFTSEDIAVYVLVPVAIAQHCDVLPCLGYR